MKTTTFYLFPMISVLALASAGVFGQTSVRETSGGDLLVIDYQGKPPFKRKLVSAEEGSDFARFEEVSETVMVNTSISRRSGAPGKSLTLQRARMERVPVSEITQFARFEETEERAGSARMWRGAPGKGRPRLGQ